MSKRRNRAKFGKDKKIRGKKWPVKRAMQSILFKKSTNLTLLFNKNEYDVKEIQEIISACSDYYSSICGDILVIKSAKVYEEILKPELA